MKNIATARPSDYKLSPYFSTPNENALVKLEDTMVLSSSPEDSVLCRLLYIHSFVVIGFVSFRLNLQLHTDRF